MKSVFLLVCVMAMATPANGEIYKWTDSQGGVHFTDNSDKIPAKYLNKAKAIDVTPEKEQVPSQTQKQDVSSGIQNKQDLYGGHDAEWWRSRYKVLRDEMKGIQDNLPAKKDELTVLGRRRTLFHKPSDRISSNDLKADIEKDEARITDLQKQLQDLDVSAAKSNVPMDWRK